MKTSEEVSVLRPEDVQAIYDLTPMQEGLLYECLRDPQGLLYVEHIEWIFRGAMDIAAFRLAWQRLVSRHDALRTQFEWRLKRPVQIVLKDIALPLALMAGTDASANAMAYLEDLRRRPMRLDAAPLMRIALVQEGGEAWRVIFTTHHLVLDAWSLRILMREWTDLYEHFAHGAPLDLAPPVPFRQVVRWFGRRRASHAQACQSRGTVDTPPRDEARHSRPPPEAWEHGVISRRLTAQESSDLRKACRQLRMTLAVLSHAVWGACMALGRAEGQMTLGSIVSGRDIDIEGVERIVGVMINCVPLTVRTDPVSTVVEWLKAFQAEHTQALDRQQLPLAHLRRSLAHGGAASLLESVVVFQNAGWTPADQKGTLKVESWTTRGHSGNPLCLRLTPDENALHVELLWQRPFRSEQEAAELVDRFCHCLRWVASGGALRGGRVGDMLSWRGASLRSSTSLKSFQPRPANGPSLSV